MNVEMLAGRQNKLHSHSTGMVHSFFFWYQNVLGQSGEEERNVLLDVKRNTSVPFVSPFVIQLYQYCLE